MKEKLKAVFYCEFCNRHGLSRWAMEKHESKCTLNPARVCRWHEEQVELGGLVALLSGEKILVRDDIDALERSTDGCPACMLAALRQSGKEYHYDEAYRSLWNYGEQVEKYRAAERHEELMSEIRDIERSWL